MNESWLRWTQNVFGMLKIGGAWGVPRSGLVFTKRGNTHVELTGVISGQPVDAHEDFELIAGVSAIAGFRVTVADGVTHKGKKWSEGYTVEWRALLDPDASGDVISLRLLRRNVAGTVWTSLNPADVRYDAGRIIQSAGTLHDAYSRWDTKGTPVDSLRAIDFIAVVNHLNGIEEPDAATGSP